SGKPCAGQCSSAATSASWARSSARPTSRTIRASAATMREDSMRQSASILRRRSSFMSTGCPGSSCVRQLGAQTLFLLPQLRCELGSEVLGLVERPDLYVGFTWHRVGATAYPLDGLVERAHLPDPVAG